MKPFQNPLGNSAETYFVEEEAQAVKKDFREELNQITNCIIARNLAMDPIKYEALMPEKIPNSKYMLHLIQRYFFSIIVFTFRYSTSSPL